MQLEIIILILLFEFFKNEIFMHYFLPIWVRISLYLFLINCFLFFKQLIIIL